MLQDRPSQFEIYCSKKVGDIEIELSKEIIVDDLFQEKVFGTNNWL